MSFKSFFGFPSKKEELALVLDVGNASVGGALVLLSSGELPTVLYGTRKPITIFSEVNFEKLFVSLSATIEAVLENLLKKGMPRVASRGKARISPRFAFCVLAAPWYASHIRTIHSSREKPFVVSKETVSALLQKEIEGAGGSLAGDYLQAGAREDELTFLEKETMHMKLNGYEVSDPWGRSVFQLEALLYLSVVPRNILEMVRKKVERSFHAEEISLHSFTLAFWSVVRDIWGVSKDFLLLDVSGEMAEVSLVRDGALVETGTFPLGRNFFIRKIMDSFRVSSHEASSLMNLYLTGKAIFEIKERLEDLCKDAEKEWLMKFQSSLRELGGGLVLPERVFLIADMPLALWLHDAIEGKEPETLSLRSAPFRVELIDEKALSHFSKTVDSPRDAFLMLLSLFAHRVLFPEG